MTAQSPISNSPSDTMEWRLRIAGVFVLLGLGVEVVALRWSHPAAFLVFAFMGIPIASLGIVIYLYSLVTVREAADGNDSGASPSKTLV
jgi:hypothetical protein